MAGVVGGRIVSTGAMRHDSARRLALSNYRKLPFYVHTAAASSITALGTAQRRTLCTGEEDIND
jgi:hypothetical protein